MQTQAVAPLVARPEPRSDDPQPRDRGDAKQSERSFDRAYSAVKERDEPAPSQSEVDADANEQSEVEPQQAGVSEEAEAASDTPNAESAASEATTEDAQSEDGVAFAPAASIDPEIAPLPRKEIPSQLSTAPAEGVSDEVNGDDGQTAVDAEHPSTLEIEDDDPRGGDADLARTKNSSVAEGRLAAALEEAVAKPASEADDALSQAAGAKAAGPHASQDAPAAQSTHAFERGGSFAIDAAAKAPEVAKVAAGASNLSQTTDEAPIDADLSVEDAEPELEERLGVPARGGSAASPERNAPVFGASNSAAALYRSERMFNPAEQSAALDALSSADEMNSRGAGADPALDLLGRGAAIDRFEGAAPSNVATSMFGARGVEVARSAGAQISAAIHQRGGETRLEVALNPPELGKVNLELSFDEMGRVSVVLQAERGDTLDLLRRHGEELAKELENAGLSLDDLSFAQSGDEQGGFGDDANDQTSQNMAFLSAPSELTDIAVPALAGRGAMLDGRLDLRV